MLTTKTIKKLCITLPEKPERTNAARDHFDLMGVTNVRMINGINGPASGLVTINPYEVDNPGSGFNIGPKYVGVWLSHYMLWQAVALMSDPCVMILEDDAEFHADWKHRVEAAMRDTPKDFDWLFIGHCCALGRETNHVAGEIFEVKYPQCFQAYILTPAGAQKLLDTQRKVYAPIDISTFFHSFPSMRVYTLLPRAVSQFHTNIPE